MRIAANLNVPFQAAVWEPCQRQPRWHAVQRCRRDPRRRPSTCSTSATCTASAQNNWDLTLRKNIRFAGKRLNFGVDIYNMFNSDAATGYNQTYTAFLAPTARGCSDNPATPAVE